MTHKSQKIYISWTKNIEMLQQCQIFNCITEYHSRVPGTGKAKYFKIMNVLDGKYRISDFTYMADGLMRT